MYNNKLNFIKSFKILFVIPTLNSYYLLPRLVKSIQRQTFKNWQILFIDGESNDIHKKWINDFCSKEKKARIIYQDKNNPGIYGAMNIGFKEAKDNEWILFWGSDDWAASKHILQDIFLTLIDLNSINNLPSLLFLQGNYISNKNFKKTRKTLINLPQKLIWCKELRRNLFFGKIPPHQTTLFGPDIRSIKSEYNIKYKLAADMDYFLSITKSKDMTCFYAPITIVNLLEGGISNKMNILRLQEVFEIYFKNFGIYSIFPFLLRYLRKIYLKIKR